MSRPEPLVVALLLAAAVLRCSNDTPQPEPAAAPAVDRERLAALDAVRSKGRDPLARVFYVGLDGADWEILDELLAAGELPHLGRLVRDGVRADLVAYEPMMSPLLWTTAITGRAPDDHGIFDFTLANRDGSQVPITSRFRESAALWEILSAWNQPSAFVNFWATHPAEEMLGVSVTDIADTLILKPDRAAALPPGVVWPPGFLDEMDELWTTDDVPLDQLRKYAPSVSEDELRAARSYWADPATRGEAARDHARKIPPVEFLLQLVANSHNLERITASLLQRADLVVIGVYFGNIDQIGHNFQHLAPPAHPLADPEERRRFGTVVENSYREQDRALGRLLEHVDADTVVLVHSDHGFRWAERRPRDVLPLTGGQPVEWHRLQGVFLAAGGPVRRGAQLTEFTLYDIVPTILALRGIPAAADMPGRVRVDMIEESSRARLPAERVPSWDPLVRRRSYGDADESELAGVRGDLVEGLRALGYVGGAGEESTEPSSDMVQGDEQPRVTYHRNKATWLMKQNRFAEVEAALLQANRIRPMSKSYSLLSEARAARGDLPGAIRALEEGFEAFPDEMPISAVLWMVELHLQRDDLPGARDALRRFGRGDSENAAPLAVASGRIAEVEGDGASAKREYLRALDLDPREVRAAQRYAALATQSERGALERYVRRGLELDSRIEVYWQMLGLMRLDAGDPAAAADAFREAGNLSPSTATYRISEAQAAMGAGQRQRARRIYEQLATNDSSVPAVWVNLGSLRASGEDWRGALDAWERAIELGADASRLQSGIGEARRRLGQPDS